MKDLPEQDDKQHVARAILRSTLPPFRFPRKGFAKPSFFLISTRLVSFATRAASFRGDALPASSSKENYGSFRMRSICWMVVILSVSSLPIRVQDPLCHNLQAIPGAIGYQHRLAPDRCEGMYQSPSAGESLELLS